MFTFLKWGIVGIVRNYGCRTWLRKKKESFAIILTDITIAMWFTTGWNDHFCITISFHLHRKKKEKPQIMLMWHLLGYLPNKHVFLHLKNKICWPGHLYSTTVSHYIMLFCHTCYIYQNTTSLTHLGRACAHVMRLRLQQQPEFDSDLRPYAMSPPLKLQLCYQRKAIGYLDDFSINYTVLLEICIVIDNTISEVWDPKQLF